MAAVVRKPETAPEASANVAPPAAVKPDRLRALSGRYLGTRYGLDCLGEGEGPDPDPLFRRDRADCQTLVEQVMAEAIAPYTGGLDHAVRQIRYREGRIALGQRYHFCIPDWLENPWPARDVTGAIGGADLPTVSRRLDLPRLVRKRGGDDSGLAAQLYTSEYIPRAAVAALEEKIPDGTIGVFVVSSPEVVSGHLGFLFRDGEQVMLRHASQRRKRVIDEPLVAYLRRAPRRFLGLMVLQPDTAGLLRTPRPLTLPPAPPSGR
ncbi:MAG: N-acetylmuramoyl-L-alanine amidase-like domain-containing protein [Armatimonadota bacterium]